MYKVLIIDDHPLIAARLKEILSDIDGLTVIAVLRDNREALDFLSLYSADLILLDHDTPTLDGLSFLSLLSARDAGEEVIVLHDAFMSDMILSYERYGCVIDYIAKPFSSLRVKYAVRHFLSRRAALSRDGIWSQNDLDFLIHGRALDLRSTEYSTSAMKAFLFLKQHKGRSFSAEDIAHALHISVPSVRRYLKLFVNGGDIVTVPSSSTIGRPTILYQYRIERTSK